MKTKTIGVALLVAASLSLSGTINANESDDWVKKHAFTSTTSTTERDANNNIKSIKVVNDTTIYIKQTCTEIKKPDAKGDIRTISRTTVSTDTLGGSATITETLPAGSSTLVTTSIRTVEKTDTGMVTTIYARNKNGVMDVVSRSTEEILKNGQAPSVVLPE